MANDPLRLQYLLTRYTVNECTRNELIELFTIIKNAEDDELLQITLTQIWQNISESDTMPDFDKEQIFNNIITQTPVHQMQPEKLYPQQFKWIRYAAAAVAVFAICLGLYTWNRKDTVKQTVALIKNTSIVPGSNKAVLILANGTRITLNDKHRGVLTTQSHIPVVQLKNGAIAYQSNSSVNAPEQSFNTLSTPRGGQYAITLIDGTKVWLNALSSLKYPVAFIGKERKVELTGEAYFEVAKNKNMPFIVDVNNSEVKVYGTHFNIMGYTSEDNTNVTLLEGSVKVTSADNSKMLIPGQQAVIKDGIAISPANGEEAIAWKNGKFNFAHEHIESIMRKLSRWYDIDVTYQGKITQEGFVGTLLRSQNLSDILKTLELTGSVHFKIEGRRVITMP